MELYDNVIQFNQSSKSYDAKNDKNIYNYLKVFLDRIGQDSPNTEVTYKVAIRDFFQYMRNKPLEELVESDLMFTKMEVQSYQVHLRNNLKASTVNTKISALKTCYENLKDNDLDVDPNWFNLKRYDEYDSEKYDTLSHDEVLEIINLVSKTRKGFEKSLLVRMAYATAFRKSALLNLEWKNLMRRNDSWYIKALDKGNKWDYKKITDSLYDELMKQKEFTGDRDKIFELTSKTVDRMMNYIRDNIDYGDRNIVFHSFKKASINEVNLITNGDIKAMQRHGNHSSVTTTLNDYVQNKELDDLVAVDTNINVSLNKLDDMSKDEIITMLNNLDRNTQIKIMNAIK